MDAISIKNLSISYGKRNVIGDLNLRVKKGEFVALLGPVGCGKTSLLLALNGIIPKMLKCDFSGTVKIFGGGVSEKNVQQMAERIAFVFQNPDDQIFSLSVKEEVAFALENRGVERGTVTKRVRSALSSVGLLDRIDDDPSELSQGQKQKVAVASAIAMDTEIIVLDEPASSLDYASASEIYGILSGLNKKGKTIIVVEHDTDFLLRHARRFLVLKDGKIRLDGGKEVFRNPLLAKAGIKVPCEMK